MSLNSTERRQSPTRGDLEDIERGYSLGEVLASQNGNATVKTFTFSATMDLIFVMVTGGDGRAQPFGGTDPDATFGVPCLNGRAVPFVIQASVVKVFAPSNTNITVWGYRNP